MLSAKKIYIKISLYFRNLKIVLGTWRQQCRYRLSLQGAVAHCPGTIKGKKTLHTHSMPNVADSPFESGSGENEHGPGKQTLEVNHHGTVKPFCASGASVASLGSSGDRLYPWGCPVTHTREKFYTICSDYAFLNQATSIRKSPSATVSACLQDNAALNAGINSPTFIGIRTDASDIVFNEDTNLEGLSSNLGKLPLAWEIDKSEFNEAAPDLKNRAGTHIILIKQ